MKNKAAQQLAKRSWKLSPGARNTTGLGGRPRLFLAASDAFDYCRERDQPVTLYIDDLAFKMYGKFKLYPSGKADKLSDIVPMAMRDKK